MSARTPAVGQAAPDFEALKSDQGRFHLSEELEPDNNVLLLFYRGHW
ncbi:MAG: hypothetical protein V3R94_13170 [Acidobacteriota bacterium]